MSRLIECCIGLIALAEAQSLCRSMHVPTSLSVRASSSTQLQRSLPPSRPAPRPSSVHERRSDRPVFERLQAQKDVAGSVVKPEGEGVAEAVRRCRDFGFGEPVSEPALRLAR